MFGYYVFGLPRRMWRYTGIKDLINIAYATALGSIITVVIVMFLAHGQGNSRSVYIIDFLFNLSLTAGMRFFVRVLRERQPIGAERPGKRVLIVGAGDAGEMMAREMLHTPEKGYLPVAFVDDDESKVGHRIHNIPVLGTTEEIPQHVRAQSIDEIVIAIPSAGGKTLRRILRYCRESAADTRALPRIVDIIAGRVTINRIRSVGVEDLLGREPVTVNLDEICGYLSGQSVLVTGAGGSIGSELCRQIVAYKPARLILVDHDENAIFAISRELAAIGNGTDVVSMVLDILHDQGIRRVFAEHRPTVVFHAAAHKHVPLMESQALEAIRNNVGGTLSLAHLSREYGVTTFVYISTDKAVEPANVMGMTKRVGELIVQAANASQRTKFVSVRFGNVLGSNGSVIPIFKKQIADAGPVTVTDPNVERYFMTIREAVELVIQTGAFGAKGETFILDMGRPVRIAKLAADLIRLSGFEPGEDIEIQYTGLRPGEKLTERLTWEGKERVAETSHPRITVVRNGVNPSPQSTFSRIEELLHAVEQQDETGALRLLHEIARS